MGAGGRKIDWPTPRDAIARWPRTRPLVALCSAPPAARHRWARWSILAAPETILRIGFDDSDPVATMFQRVRATALGSRGTGNDGPPFAGGWIVALNYELGRVLEPHAAFERGVRVAHEWPWAIVMWRCPNAYVYDHDAGTWSCVGSGDADASLFPRPVSAARQIGPAILDRPRSCFTDGARRAIDYIHAGDAFEVNLSHRLGAWFAGSARSMFLDMFARAAPWYGAYLEVAGGGHSHAALSVSPELFLEFDARTRQITTRPIKGTRPGHTDPLRLAASPKDRAELNMIVDLMRNDLGRVADYGSVRVADPLAIERHATPIDGDAPTDMPERSVLHGVATVEARLRDDADLEGLLRAAFPPGSITGAPKVRAMQIIEELEPTPRGLYTGAIGFISDCGNMTLNVAIRTAVLHGTRDPARDAIDEIAAGRLTYGVGAGIVADSDPQAEFEETLDKAGVLPGARPVSITTRPAQAGVAR